jgi:predicted amidohydrolase YtcJ
VTALRLHGGTIRTLAGPVPDELLVEGGHVVDRAAGGRDVDLRGACVLPGLNDAHVHFPTWSVAQRQVRLEGTRTVEEALDRVAAAARGLPAGHWLRGLGWRAADWDPPTEPDRAMLDRAAPGVPVALMARDYHSLWVSSAGLERAGGDLAAPGGVVEADAAGEPTGVLREAAAWAFRDRFSAPTSEEYLAAMRDGLALAASRGVTAIHDKDGWLDAPALFDALAQEGPLPLRVWQSVLHDRMGAQRGDYVKAFLDGTVGSGTALLLDGGGVAITGYEEFAEIVLRAAERGLPVAVHAIGDLANRRALDAFAATRDAWGPLGLRQRIEHAQLLAADDVARFAELGVTASVQFSHATADRDLADDVWAGMTGRAYAYRSLLDAGARLANGSDAPVEELDPLAGVAAGVRRTIDGRPAWHPEQRVTIEEALHATCVTPVWLARDEHRRGKLAPGMAADLVVLDRDPMAVAPEELGELRVLATMCGGRATYEAPDAGLGLPAAG